MKKKIPVLCRLKNRLAENSLLWRSPSASIRCEYGFHYQTHKCENCPKRFDLGRYLK